MKKLDLYNKSYKVIVNILFYDLNTHEVIVKYTYNLGYKEINC